MSTIPDSKVLPRFVVAVLVLACLFAFSPALTGNWLGDDHHLVVEASCNHGIENVADIVRLEAQRCNYRPMRHISYAIDYELWGLTPLGYHITNLLMHIVTALLVYAVFSRTGLSTGFAALGAALFALHPVQVDAVGYISGRRDVLMGLGYMAAFYGAVRLSQLRQQEDSPRRAYLWALLTLVATVISVTSKEMGVTIVATVSLFFLLGGWRQLALREHAQRGGLLERISKHKFLLAALALPTTTMVIWRGILSPNSTVTGLLFGGTVERHLATIFSIHARYVELLFVPVRLAGDYAPPVIAIPKSLLVPSSVIGAIWLAVLLSAAILFCQRGWLRASFGLWWYMLTMLPVSHIIPHHEIAAEHYLYIPLVGLAWCAADLVQRGWLQHSRTTIRLRRYMWLGITVIVLSLLAARSFVRSYDYRSEISHAEATVRHYPASVRGRARLGLALLNQYGLTQARSHLEYVLGTSFQGSARRDVLRELGEYLVDRSDYQRAIRLLEEYRQLRPGDPSALAGLSKAYFELKQYEDAFQVNQQLVVLRPNSADAHYKLALTSWILGDQEEALRSARRAITLDSTHIDALLLAANLSTQKVDSQAAKWLQLARESLAKEPESSTPKRRRLLRKLEERLH